MNRFRWCPVFKVAESEEIDPEEETPLRLEEGLEPSRREEVKLSLRGPASNLEVMARSS